VTNRKLAFLVATASTMAGASALAAAPTPKATFALIIGVNRAVDSDLPTLRYADDDAARYQDLFRALGARTYLLTRPDDNTARLHAQAVAEAREPRRPELRQAAAALRADVAQARARGIATVFYVVYAGHGNTRDGTGYLTLEDSSLGARAIVDEIVDVVAADQAHLVVDACYSYFLAYGRGPGGQRREAHGFVALEALAHERRMGLLLSTSAGGESHEWEGFQAGVFSHEVRSGLYGAADADGDGEISYREIAAFVQRANAAIPNERFRPDVLARPPAGTDQLLDLRGGLGRHIQIDGKVGAAHYLLEDSRGVRIADFHNASDQATRIVRPPVSGPIYMRRLADGHEYLLPAGPDVLEVAAIIPQPPRVASRGAAHHAFSLIFALPFDRVVVEAFTPPTVDVATAPPRDAPPSQLRRYSAIGAFAMAVATAASGVATTISAHSLRNGARPEDSQAAIASRNDRMHTRELVAAVLYGMAGASAAAGGFLIWDSGAPTATGSSTTSSFGIGYRGRF